MIPATKTSESPGRKKPKNTPVSVKITNSNKAIPPYWIMDWGLKRSDRVSVESTVVALSMLQVANVNKGIKISRAAAQLCLFPAKDKPIRPNARQPDRS